MMDLETAIIDTIWGPELDNILSYKGLVYHYTSSESFLSILKSDKSSDIIKLWFTRSDCVNDRSEGKFVDELYRSVCADLLKSQTIDEGYYKKISNIYSPNDSFSYEVPEIITQIDGVEKRVNSTYTRLNYDSYICCFSKSADSLPMWNYYVNNSGYQGYNIGISDISLHRYNNVNKGYLFEVYEVLYNKDEQRKKIQDIIMKFYPFKEQDQGNEILNMISSVINNYKLFFKSEYFKHEEEVRAVIKIPTEPLTYAINLENFNMDYRTRNGLIIPYIEKELPKGVVFNVSIGPLIPESRELAKSTVANMLSNCGYENVEINVSNIPIRF